MDDITDQVLGGELLRATEAATREQRASVVSVAAALRTRVSGPEDPRKALVAALERCPVDPGAGGEPGEPMLALWARSVAFAPRPLVGARFADLLWTAGYGDAPQEWAQRAIDSYVAAVDDQFGHVLEISEGLQRAFVIAAEISDQPRHAAVVSALLGLATRSMEGEERSSGVSLSIIGFLADRPDSDRPPELEALLDRARYRYRDDPWLLEDALDIKAGLVGPDARARLHLEQVAAFAGLAHRSDGLLRHALYEHAIEIAERHGLPIVDDLRRDVDAPLVELPPDPVAEFVARIVGDDTLADALARFGACLPTEGAAAALEKDEIERLSFFGILAVELLARIRGRYGAVSAAGAWFGCALIDATVSSRMAHGIRLYESGDFNASAAVLEPQLEQIIRLIAATADPTVSDHANLGTTPDDGNGLSDVLAALAGALYEPTRRYLQALLSAPTESFARDRVERGASDAVKAEDAALLVHAACHLRLLQPVDSTL